MTKNGLCLEVIGQSVYEPQGQGRVSEMEIGVVGKVSAKQARINVLSELWGQASTLSL